VKYPEVHCNYQSLGESLMPGGEVHNFLIPCFCRMLFKEKHPASSGRHYFFPHVGVGNSCLIPCLADFFMFFTLVILCFCPIFLLCFLSQEAILKYNVVPNEVLVRTSFVGVAKASRGRNLGCSDNRVRAPFIIHNMSFPFL
jgi:hypothetical protein